jgi:hypothetical protein
VLTIAEVSGEVMASQGNPRSPFGLYLDPYSVLIICLYLWPFGVGFLGVQQETCKRPHFYLFFMFIFSFIVDEIYVGSLSCKGE